MWSQRGRVLGRSVLSDCGPVDCSPPGSPVHRVSQARILEWVARPSCRGHLPFSGIEPASLASPALAGGVLYHWSTWEFKC